MTESSIEQLPDTPPADQKPSLFRRVLKSAAWAFGGHAASQVIRLGNNLILSRLLFPEAFGLMALVFSVLTGLQMLSDTGTNASIIQSKRGDDQAFLNTAWSVDCIRGVVLWLCACLLAIPMASFYKEPMLINLLPVAGLSLLFCGFESNKLAIANRNLTLGRITIIDLCVQISGIVVVLIGATLAKFMGAPKEVAVWSLIIGNLASSIVRVVLSYTFLEGENNRFQIEPKALQEIFHFGKWIFLSTLLTFFAFQGNNLIIPRLVGFGFLGVFSFASGLAQLASSIVSTLESRVLFPSFSELNRDHPEKLRPTLKRARIVLNGVNCAVSLFFICFGQLLIQIMYDNRYSDAGWILQLLALGSIMTVLSGTYMNILLAQGKTNIMTLMLVLQTGMQFIGMLVGYHLGKELGLVIGLMLSGWAIYPFAAIMYARLYLWQPDVDFPIIGLATATAAFLFLF